MNTKTTHYILHIYIVLNFLYCEMVEIWNNYKGKKNTEIKKSVSIHLESSWNLTFHNFPFHFKLFLDKWRHSFLYTYKYDSILCTYKCMHVPSYFYFSPSILNFKEISSLYIYISEWMNFCWAWWSLVVLTIPFYIRSFIYATYVMPFD